MLSSRSVSYAAIKGGHHPSWRYQKEGTTRGTQRPPSNHSQGGRHLSARLTYATLWHLWCRTSPICMVFLERPGKALGRRAQ